MGGEAASDVVPAVLTPAAAEAMKGAAVTNVTNGGAEASTAEAAGEAAAKPVAEVTAAEPTDTAAGADGATAVGAAGAEAPAGAAVPPTAGAAAAEPSPAQPPATSAATESLRLPPVKLLRGFSGCGEDESVIVELVVNALDSWATLDRKAIVVQEHSGEGAMVTHKVTGPPGAEPAAVALHCWADDEDVDPIYRQRTSAGGQLFAKHGLAPPRLAEGSDWFLEPWEGSGNPKMEATRMEELGELVAAVHRLPTAWFEAFREQLCQRLPELRQVPQGSHVWWWTAKEDLLGDCPEHARRVWLEADWFAPATAAGQRIVTAHADMHYGNMLQTESGIRVIDFEYTCVTHAVLDLAFAAATNCSGDPAQKRAFIEAYLRASGQPASEEDVDALHFDAELAFLGCHTAPLELWIAHDEPDKWLQRVALFRTLVEDARRFPELRAQVLERGIVGYLNAYKGFCLANAPVMLCGLPHCDANRLAVSGDGTLSPLALRTRLAVGVGADGALLLAPRGDARVLRLAALRGGRALPLAAAELRQAGVVFTLVLANNPAFGIIGRPGSRHLARGSALVEVLQVGPAAAALPLSFEGSFLVHRGAAGERLSFYVGNAEYDIGRSQAQELYEAADHEDLEALRALLAKGADVNFPQEHESLGHLAARSGHLAVLDLLLNAGLDANASSESYGGSALVEAATYGHVHCVERLLRVPGLDLTLTDDGRTALEWAKDPSQHCEASAAHTKIVALLEAHERQGVHVLC